MSITMSVHRALGEIKTLKSRIENKINTLVVAKATHKKDLTADVRADVSTHELAITQAAEIQSIRDLIENHDKIKAAIVESNAVTKITIGEKTYTIAGALEYKSGIARKKALLAKLRERYYGAALSVDKHNAAAKTQSEQAAERSTANLTENKSEEFKRHYDFIMDSNEVVLITPKNMEESIKKLEDEIVTFEKEIDILLSESNIATNITIE